MKSQSGAILDPSINSNPMAEKRLHDEEREFVTWELHKRCSLMSKPRPCNLVFLILPLKAASDIHFLCCMWTFLVKLLCLSCGRCPKFQPKRATRASFEGKIQGDHSACDKPPVDIKTKLPFWPGLAEAELLLCSEREVCHKLNGHPVHKTKSK